MIIEHFMSYLPIRWPSAINSILKLARCSFSELKLLNYPDNYFSKFKNIKLPACFRFLSFTAFDMMSNNSSSEAPSRSGSLDQNNLQIIQIGSVMFFSSAFQ